MGLSLSILICIGYFSLNKSIGAVNKLMHQLQFFAYTSVWLIGTTTMVKSWLTEIKRIVLQEYFDDLDLSGKVMMELGIGQKDDSVEEKTGESRLGSTNLLKNLGLTLLLFLALLLALILLVFLAQYILERAGYKGKIK